MLRRGDVGAILTNAKRKTALLVLIVLCSYAVAFGDEVSADARNQSDLSTNRSLEEQECTLVPHENLERAWTQAQRDQATGMIVYQNDALVFEAYETSNICGLCGWDLWRSLTLRLYQPVVGGSPTTPLRMYSATKSLTGLAALLLVKQGKLDLDETVATYIPEWNSDANKLLITFRELLSLSSGIVTRVGRRISSEEAIASPFRQKQFDYGTEPFAIFAFILEKITGQDAEAFLKEHLFDELGMELTLERFRLGEGELGVHNLAYGGIVTLPELVKLAKELLAASLDQGQIFDSSDIQVLTTAGLNPAYGLSFWLNDRGVDPSGGVLPPLLPACTATGAFHMLGAGGQAVTIVPELQLIMVKSVRLTATGASQSDIEVYEQLFDQVECSCQ